MSGDTLANEMLCEENMFLIDPARLTYAFHDWFRAIHLACQSQVIDSTLLSGGGHSEAGSREGGDIIQGCFRSLPLSSHSSHMCHTAALMLQWNTPSSTSK